MTGPGPAVSQVRVAVRRHLGGLPAGALVLAGVSGGADSMALAAATVFEARAARLRAGAVVVDHGLAGPQVAADAGDWCADLGLDPVEVVPVRVPADGTGPEAAARTVRYRAFEQALARHDAAVLLLGHTLDDQAEQVLLGLARGSGARSLAGMPAVRGPYRRPLLGLTRDLVRQAATDQGLPTWQDPTNTDDRYTRNRVRSHVLPVLEQHLGPGVARALARTADQLAEDTRALETLAADLLTRAGHPGGLDVAVLARAPAALRRRALRAAVLAAGAPAGRVGRAHILAVDALLTGWRGQGPVFLPGGLRLLRRDGMLVVEGTGPSTGPPQADRDERGGGHSWT